MSPAWLRNAIIRAPRINFTTRADGKEAAVFVLVNSEGELGDYQVAR